MSRQDQPDVVAQLDWTVGHLLRRAQQVHTAIWLAEFNGEFTGPQFGLLLGIFHNGPLDQTAVGRLVSLDRSTAADVISRLVRRGWIVRSRDRTDARRNTLALTSDARAIVSEMTSRVLDTQERFMAPIAPGEREWFIDRLAMVAFAGRLPTEKEAFVPLRLVTLPGHLIRRAEQVHDSHWAELIGSRITPSQYGRLTGIASEELVDQRRAGALASLDRSSTSNIAGRLIGRGLIAKETDEGDRRRKLLSLTDEGWDLMNEVAPAMWKVQAALMEPLSGADANRLTGLLRTAAYRGRPVDERVFAA